MSWERQLGFYAGVIGFALGNIAVYLVGYFIPIFIGFGILLCLTFMAYTKTGRYVFAVLSFFLLFVLVGLVRTDAHRQTTLYSPLDEHVGAEITLTGFVCEEPDVRDFNTRLTICLENNTTKILAKVSTYPTFSYGDELRVQGTLEVPKGFVGDTNRFFDYQNYLLQDGVRYITNYPELTLTKTKQGSVIKLKLLQLKHSFLHQLRLLLPEPHVSFMGGLLLGAKSSMGEELLEDFRSTGVIHIVVLSGFNITIVAGFFMATLAGFGLVISSIVGSVAILFFAIMTGAGATVVRASLMAFLVIVARLTGNNALVIRMLFLSAFIMLWANPMLLLYNPSFQLSFVATLGLVTLAPWVAKYLWFIPNPKIAQIRELVSATLATQIMVTPLLLYMMGTFPTYAPFANFLVLATIPYTMALGFITALVSYISTTLATPFAVVSYVLLEYNLVVVDFFARLPWASFDLPPFGFGYVVITYIIYAAISAYIHRGTLKQGIQRLFSK